MLDYTNLGQVSDIGRVPGAQEFGSRDGLDVVASKTGDEGAFARLVERLDAWVRAYLSRFTRNEADAADLCQHVWLEVFRSLPGFDGQGAFQSWLRQISARVGYRHWRQRARDKRSEQATSRCWTGGCHPGRSPKSWTRRTCPGGSLVSFPTRVTYWSPNATLTETPPREIAHAMGWPENRVRVRIHRAPHNLPRLALGSKPWESGRGGKGNAFAPAPVGRVHAEAANPGIIAWRNWETSICAPYAVLAVF